LYTTAAIIPKEVPIKAKQGPTVQNLGFFRALLSGEAARLRILLEKEEHEI